MLHKIKAWWALRKEQQEFERELDAALIDPMFLDRAMIGLDMELMSGVSDTVRGQSSRPRVVIGGTAAQ